MQRFSFARFLLSLFTFVVLAAGGIALGWIQQDQIQTARGKEVVVLALEPDAIPGEIILGALENASNSVEIQSLPATQTQVPDSPYGSTLANDAPLAPSFEPEGTELVITLPSAGNTAPKRLGTKGGPPPEITPVALAGTGPILALPAVPKQALIENGKYGPLPKVAANGQKALTLYARPFVNIAKKPVVVVVIGGIGINRAYSADALTRLPGQISFSFSPYVSDLSDWVAASRKGGHEALIELPMEPYGYPETDPGPRALLTSLDIAQNRDNLLWHLSRMPGYIGVTNHLGSKFATDEDMLRIVLRDIANRGLMFVETPTRRSKISTVAAKVSLPYARARIIDPRPSKEAIRRRLDELVVKAKADGKAVGIGIAHPATIDAVVEWASTLEARGVVLAPVSSVMK